MERKYMGLLDDRTAVRLSVEDDGLRVQVDRYHDPDIRTVFQNSPLASTLTLPIGGGQFASLNGIVPIVRTRRFDHEQQTLRATSLVIGPEPFVGTERIRGIKFVPTNELHAIYWTGHRRSGSLATQASSIDQIGVPSLGRFELDVVDSEKLEAAHVAEGGMSVAMNILLMSEHSCQGTHRKEQRRVWLGYEEGRSLDEAIGDVQYVCAFMSMLLGMVIAPTELEFEVSEPESRSGQRYQVHSQFRVPAREMEMASMYTGLMSPNKDRARYEGALRAWIARRDDWQLATTFALEALAMNGRLDRIRFLNATSWFEAIPDIYMISSDVIPRTDLDEAAGSAVAILAGLGHSDLGNRVRGLMGNLNTPSLAMRLQAALAWLRVRYGSTILPPNAEETCRLVPAIRGSYAHGDDPLLGRHAGSVLEAALLTEAICYLLMLAGLGFDLDPGIGTDHVLMTNLMRLNRLARMRVAASASASA